LPRHLFDSSVNLGDIPVPGTVLLAGPSTAGKEFGGALSLMAPVAVRSYVRRSSDLVQKPDLPSVQLRWICRRPHWQVGAKMRRVAPDTSPVHLVSPSSLRQGPKSSTGSARMPLAVVTSLNTGSLTVLGSLDRGRYPSYGTANRRSFGSLGFSSESPTLGRFEKEAEVALRP
jgi:hypothetical protein